MGYRHLSTPRNNHAQHQHGAYSYRYGAYEAATAAAASAKSSGKQWIGSLYSHLPSRGGVADVSESSPTEQSNTATETNDEATSIVQNELPYELAPPAAVSISRGYSNSSGSDPATRDLISSSVHTETYIFDDGNDDGVGINSSSVEIFVEEGPLFSREQSLADAPEIRKDGEDDDASYATANVNVHDDGEETILSGISLADDDEDGKEIEASYRAPSADANNARSAIDDDTVLHPPPETWQQASKLSSQESEYGEDYFYNADEQHHSTLREEIAEVLQEDIGRVNDAFLDTLHKTSALMAPIATAARRQRSTPSPVRQRLAGMSQRAIGMTRSVSERASSTAAVVIPTRQSIRKDAAKLWDKAHEAEETLAHAAGEAMSHVHVPTMQVPAMVSDAVKSIEAAAEELRINDVNIQSDVDDAELLSQLTAGAYA